MPGVSGTYYLLKNDTPSSRRDSFRSWHQWIGPYDQQSSYAVVKYALNHVPTAELGAYDAQLFMIFDHVWANEEKIVRMIIAARSDVTHKSLLSNPFS